MPAKLNDNKRKFHYLQLWWWNSISAIILQREDFKHAPHPRNENTKQDKKGEIPQPKLLSSSSNYPTNLPYTTLLIPKMDFNPTTTVSPSSSTTSLRAAKLQ